MSIYRCHVQDYIWKVAKFLNVKNKAPKVNAFSICLNPPFRLRRAPAGFAAKIGFSPYRFKKMRLFIPLSSPRRRAMFPFCYRRRPVNPRDFTPKALGETDRSPDAFGRLCRMVPQEEPRRCPFLHAGREAAPAEARLASGLTGMPGQ